MDNLLPLPYRSGFSEPAMPAPHPIHRGFIVRNAFIKLHLSIMLAGFTGVLGKLISLPEVPLVWWRMLMTSILFGAFMYLSGRLHRLALREFLKIAGVGVLLTLHWIFFYGSIKYANVSVGVVCFALTGCFTAVLEPVALRRRFSPRELLFSLLTVSGVALIFHFDTRYRTGITLGVISSAMAASFTIGNKVVGRNHASTTMLLYQMLSGFCFISLILPLFLHVFPGATMKPARLDLLYLFLLVTMCTIVMYLLQLQALQSISAFTVNLSYNLEPVYSIAIAMVFLGEAAELGPSFYAGLVLICMSVALQTLSALRTRPSFPVSASRG